MSNAPDALGNVSPAQDQEVIFYEGSPKLRGESSLIFKCGLAAIVILLIPLIVHFVSANTSIVWLTIICVLIAIGVFCLPLLIVRKDRYRISNYRIDHESGLLSKRIDTIELWHVADVRMEQSLFDRIMGVGTIEIFSNDNTTPDLPLRSLPEPRKLLDAIKQRIIAVKRQRGVVKYDGGSSHGDDMPNMDDGGHHHHG